MRTDRKRVKFFECPQSAVAMLSKTILGIALGCQLHLDGVARWLSSLKPRFSVNRTVVPFVAELWKEESGGGVWCRECRS